MSTPTSPGCASTDALPAWHRQTLDCVHCGLCLEACPTYGVLGTETDSPRGRLYLMRAFAEGRVADPEAIRPHLDRCLDCRACETACPSGVRYGAILETVREELRASPTRTRTLRMKLASAWLRHVVAHVGRLRWFFRLARFAEWIGLRRLARAMRILPPEVDALLPRVPSAAERRPLPALIAAQGERRGRVAFFAGCVMESVFGEINRKTVELLASNGFEVVVPQGQRCCGALLVHDGQREPARALAAANVAAFANCEVVITNSAGCGAMLREYGELLGTAAADEFAHRCLDITAFLAREGLRETPARCEARVAYDAPCHLCHAQGVRTQPAELLKQVPGLSLVPHATSEDCCGSAGIYNLLQPSLAAAIGRRKADALATGGAELVATGNPGCMMQIAACLRAAETPLRVVHPVELLLPPPKR